MLIIYIPFICYMLINIHNEIQKYLYRLRYQEIHNIFYINLV
jgi:hypothetical protein